MGKKYCIFSAQYLPHMGGVERYTYYLAKKLVSHGNYVTIVTNNTVDSIEYEKGKGMEIYRFPCYPLIDGRFPIPKIDKEFIRIDKILKQKHFDLVIINTRFYFHSLYAARFAKKRKIYSICIEHGTSHLSVHDAMLDKIGALYEHFHTAILKKYCKHYYGVSKACTEWSAHFGIKAEGVLYNAIDIKEIESVSQNMKRRYRINFSIPKDGIVVTFTGRLLQEKGLPSLLNVAEKMQQEYSNVYFFIAGDGDMKEEVEKRKSEHIIYLGKIDFLDIVNLLKDSDIFCLPSFSEGLSTSILEAAACKCYIITTARGGARELMIDESYGTIIPENSEKTLFNALKAAIQNPEHRDRAVELTYNRLIKLFNWNVVATKVEEICKQNS